MAQRDPKKLAPARRLLGLAMIAVGVIGSFALGWVLVQKLLGPGSAPEIPKGPQFAIGHGIIMLFVGGCALCGGVAGYVLVRMTTGFTFDFRTPVWSGYQKRLRVFNVVVPLLWALGLGCWVSIVATPLLMQFNLSASLAAAIPIGLSVITLQFLLIWCQIWEPVVVSLTRKRLAAYGVAPRDIQRGRCIGISDPDSSRRKLGQAEDDIGMLWIEPSRLIYRGDTESFDIEPFQLSEIEREVDPNSVAAYGGAVHVVLRTITPEGKVRRIRLHVEGPITLSAKARELDRLAEDLETWQHAPSPETPDGPLPSGSQQ